MNINSTKLCASTVGRYMFYCIHVVLGSKTVQGGSFWKKKENNSCNTTIKRFIYFKHSRHNREEEQTVGIDLSNSCSFSNLHDRWQMAIQGDYEKEADMQEEQKQLGILGNILIIWFKKLADYAHDNLH